MTVQVSPMVQDALDRTVEFARESTAASDRESVCCSLAEALPTLPHYVFDLNQMLDATPIDLKRVAQLIRMDPSLVAQVMRICHTMPYAEPMLNIEAAVEAAGPDRIRALAMTCKLVETPYPE